jgi:hypothetical protein
MATWYTAAQNITACDIQHEIQYPLREVVRRDGKFPYRPSIVIGPRISVSIVVIKPLAHALARPWQICPRPQKVYEAQIGLEDMEEQAARTARLWHQYPAKWRLEALASRANSHFAHLCTPLAVANCALCRTSTVGRAVLDWVLTAMSMNPTATHPINFRTPGYPRDRSLETTAEVRP